MEVVGADGTFVQEGLVPFVVDAVYSLGHALHSMQERLCEKSGDVCSAMLPLAGPVLLADIRNVSFIGQCRISSQCVPAPSSTLTPTSFSFIITSFFRPLLLYNLETFPLRKSITPMFSYI